MTFTDVYIRGLKSKDKKYYVNEGNGFYLLVRPTGAKIFYIRYTHDGKEKFKQLGTYPHMSLSDARGKFYEAKKLLHDNTDPAAPPPEPAASQEELSVQEICNNYFERSEKHHSAAVTYIAKSTINKHVIPKIGNRVGSTITRRDAVELIASIPTDGAARNVYKHMRAAYQHAVDMEYLIGSPFEKLNRPLPQLTQPVRKRVLSPTELKTVWAHLIGTHGSDEVRNAMKMILITAQRPGEVAGMHSDEIDEDWDGDKWWTIPGERTKNGNAHMVYLSPMALELIGKKKGYIFAPEGSTEPLRRLAMSHLVAKKTLGKEPYYGLPRWTPHDLRRTARTNFSRMGVPLPVAEAILNHAKEGMVKVYDLHEYKDEKKKAMLMWDRELGKLFG